MSDLIDRESAIVRACAAIKDDYVAYDVVQALKAMPSVQPEKRTDKRTKTHACDYEHTETNAQWIPVTKRLPEEYKDVLCYYEYFRYGDYNCMFRTIDRGYYGNGRWGGEAGQGHKNKVLAWMPLPEPYKEGE